ncbi:hypothetical protein [Streptomyces sp. NPDC001340]
MCDGTSLANHSLYHDRYQRRQLPADRLGTRPGGHVTHPTQGAKISQL